MDKTENDLAVGHHFRIISFYYLEAKWSRWSPWSDCSKTCGSGTRSRTRTCVAINQNTGFTPVSCAGKPMQSKTCAEWNCPGLRKIT